MEPGKDRFLDKNTFFAIAFLGFCWVAWDIYMKKKYPRRATAPAAETGAVPHAPLKTAAAESVAPPQELKREKPEKIFFYSGKRADISLSSKGMGVKEFRLKEFFDSEGKEIVFKSGETPLFASLFFGGQTAIPFEVRQERGKASWRGVYRSKEAEIIKTAELDEEKFALKTKIQIKRSGSGLKGLGLALSHPLPKENSAPWYLSLLFPYGRDVFKGFALSDSGAERFLEGDLEGGKNYPRLSAAAMGGKFFGAAFINRSSLFPSGSFKNTAGFGVFRGEYKFLSQRPITLEYLAFLGPKSLETLQSFGAEGWLDFGFFSWLARPLLWILKFLFGQTQNWGFAIVLLTLLVRLCLLPINLKSYKSMKIMRKIQPQLQKLKEEHKDNPQKMNAEWLALMKSNKASPFGGCLPIFFQLPVFVALYRVLGESVELYQAPFVMWIGDLSRKDPFYLLPVLSGLTFFIQQKITPMGLPKAQARLLAMAPLVFTVFMLSLPSGLTLYLFVSGLFGLVQQAFFVRIKGADAETA